MKDTKVSTSGVKRRISATVHGPVDSSCDTVGQHFAIKRFGQDAYGSLRKCLRAKRAGSVGGDEYDGKLITPACDCSLQLKTAKSRHLNVCNQTIRLSNPDQPKKLFGRRKGSRQIPERSQEPRDSLTNPRIVIDDRNGGRLSQNCSFGLRFSDYAVQRPLRSSQGTPRDGQTMLLRSRSGPPSSTLANWMSWATDRAFIFRIMLLR